MRTSLLILIRIENSHIMPYNNILILHSLQIRETDVDREVTP